MADYKFIVQRIGLVCLTNISLSLNGINLFPIFTKNILVEDYGIWAQFSAHLTEKCPMIPQSVNGKTQLQSPLSSYHNFNILGS